MGVINMAHGEMVMLGAYTTFVVQELIRNNAPWLFDWSLAIALPLAFLVAGAVGIVIERGIIRFLYGRPLETLLATWGVSLILQQAVRTDLRRQQPRGRQPVVDVRRLRRRQPDDHLQPHVDHRLRARRLRAAACVVLRFTSFGLQMRAVTQNRAMASAMGIRTPWIDALTFGLGSGIAGIAGVALSQIDNVSPNLGQGYIIDSLHGRGLRRRRQSLGHAGRRLLARHRQQVPRAVRRRGARQDRRSSSSSFSSSRRRPRGLFALRGRAVEA